MITAANQQEIRDLAAEVPEDGRGRFICPVCGGGSANEKSLVIGRAYRNAYARCWRASCELGSYAFRADGSFIGKPKQPTPKRQVMWDEPTTVAPPDLPVVQWGEAIGVTLRLTNDGRLVIPMLDRYGHRRGDLVRQNKPYNERYPKAMSYYSEDYDGMAWFTPLDYVEGDAPVCIVEDAPSALRLAANGVLGISLNGTEINAARVSTLMSITGTINLALDADAYLKSAKYAHTLRNCMDMRVHSLFNDVKEMDSEELRNFLGSLVV